MFKSVIELRIKVNFELDDWELIEEEVKKIDVIFDWFKVCGDDWLLIKVFFGDDE